MSLVILIANEKIAYLCGDRRMTSVSLRNEFEPIYSDTTTKVFKLNDEIMLGIVGNHRFCNQFFNPIILNGSVNELNKDISYIKMIQFLDARFERFIDDIKRCNNGTEEHLDFAGVVVGKENGKICGVTYGYPLLDNKPQRLAFDGERVKLLTYGDKRHELVFVEEYKRSKHIGNARISESFHNTLINGVLYDKSINTQFDVEEIEV